VKKKKNDGHGSINLRQVEVKVFGRKRANWMKKKVLSDEKKVEFLREAHQPGKSI
jgi:hypothetical protein